MLTYYHVDVFTTEKFGGNQLAVFTDADWLTDAQMQALAREMNFAESSFLLPTLDPNIDHELKIFTPFIEMPMAGHPTIGTACVLHHLGQTDGNMIRFQEKVGPVPVEIETLADGARFWMTQNNPTITPSDLHQLEIADLLGLQVDDLHPELPFEVVDCGVPYLIIPLASRKAVDKVLPRPNVWQHILQARDIWQIFTFAPDPVHRYNHAYCRMFSTEGISIIEDAATGSAAGPLGCYGTTHDIFPLGTLLGFEQGYAMGRPSQIYVSISETDGAISRVQVGGQAVYMGQGTIVW